jgi:hypothetical protein
MEERIAKLEAIIHRLLCCNNSALIGPMGPQGPVGESIQGPPGPQGPVGPAGLNWQGAWVSGVTYVADDAVGYNGASWFVTCEEVVNPLLAPDVNPCFALLANVGATGPQGSNGVGGNDGSNSGRWIWQGPSVMPSSLNFSTNSRFLSAINNIQIHKSALGGDYYDWLNILTTLNFSIIPAYLQITKVGNNSVIGIYEVIGTNGFISPANEVASILLNWIGGQSTQLLTNEQYSVSWVLNGVESSVSKTVAYVTTSTEGTPLSADFNIVTLSDTRTDCVYLPSTTKIGQEVFVFVKDLVEGNESGYVASNGEPNTPAELPDSTGFITTHGIDNGASNVRINPNGNYKFTFLGNIAAGGKAFWNMEALPNTYFSLNYSDQSLYNSSTELNSYYIALNTVTLTSASLNALFPAINGGEQVFAPNQPGGAKMFVNNGAQWLSFNLNIVL